MATANRVRRSRTGAHAWFTSTRSASNANCVEVATTVGGILVRDSKDPAGPVLEIAPQAWSAFLGSLT